MKYCKVSARTYGSSFGGQCNKGYIYCCVYCKKCEQYKAGGKYCLGDVCILMLDTIDKVIVEMI